MWPARHFEYPAALEESERIGHQALSALIWHDSLVRDSLFQKLRLQDKNSLLSHCFYEFYRATYVLHSIKMHRHSRYLALVAIFNLSRAQNSNSLVGPYLCRPDAGITELPACDETNSTVRECFGTQQSDAAIEACFCKQDVINAIVE